MRGLPGRPVFCAIIIPDFPAVSKGTYRRNVPTGMQIMYRVPRNTAQSLHVPPGCGTLG